MKFTCQFCGGEGDAKPCRVKDGGARYCSKSCHSKAMMHSRFPCTPNFKCEMCSKPIYRNKFRASLSKSGLYFCSMGCRHQSQKVENGGTKRWPNHHVAGGEYAYRDSKARTSQRVCERCGFDKYPGIIHTHHKDRNRCNNAPDNLEYLCPNCHEIEHFIHKDGRFWMLGGVTQRLECQSYKLEV